MHTTVALANPKAPSVGTEKERFYTYPSPFVWFSHILFMRVKDSPFAFSLSPPHYLTGLHHCC